MAEENKLRDAADAIKGIVQAVPVYQDALQPALQEVGVALQTVARTIHIALAPVAALVWGYDQIKEFVTSRLAEKLQNVPPERITSPSPNVAGPVLEALRYTGHQETLRDLYANLLAASMDSATANGAHPAFVDIIRQLTPDEAKIVRLFAEPRSFPLITVRRVFRQPTEELRGGVDVLSNFSMLGWEADCAIPTAAPIYINNLCRLGLAELPAMFEYTAVGLYDPLIQFSQVKDAIRIIEATPGFAVEIRRGGLQVTSFGSLFCRVCVLPHEGLWRKDSRRTSESSRLGSAYDPTPGSARRIRRAWRHAPIVASVSASMPSRRTVEDGARASPASRPLTAPSNVERTRCPRPMGSQGRRRDAGEDDPSKPRVYSGSHALKDLRSS